MAQMVFGNPIIRCGHALLVQVDHVVECLGVDGDDWIRRLLGEGSGDLPKLILNFLRFGDGCFERCLLILGCNPRETDVDVTSQQTDGLCAGGLAEHLRTEVGGADGVGFIDDEFLAMIEAREGHGEGEAEQKAEQHRNLGAGVFNLRVLGVIVLDFRAEFEAESDFRQGSEYHEEQKEKSQWMVGDVQSASGMRIRRNSVVEMGLG